MGIGDAGDSGDGIGTSLPSFGSRNDGETLHAAIIHYSFSWKNSMEPKESLCPRFNNNIVVLARVV